MAIPKPTLYGFWLLFSSLLLSYPVKSQSLWKGVARNGKAQKIQPQKIQTLYVNGQKFRVRTCTETDSTLIVRGRFQKPGKQVQTQSDSLSTSTQGIESVEISYFPLEGDTSLVLSKKSIDSLEISKRDRQHFGPRCQSPIQTLGLLTAGLAVTVACSYMVGQLFQQNWLEAGIAGASLALVYPVSYMHERHRQTWRMVYLLPAESKSR